MTLGPLMLDLEGTALTPAERELLAHPNVGGVVLFARNVVDRQQVAALTAEIHGLRDPHLLVAVDQEGGRVQRLREGFTELPPMARLGAAHDRDPAAARAMAGTLGWILAAELLAVGIDFSFAPVLDLDRGLSRVIGHRAFHGDPDVVATLGEEVVGGMRRAGMAAVGKHFPGHGGVTADSHHELPVDPRDRADILHTDAIAFERLIQTGLPAIMPAHVRYPAVDDRPAGYSRVWLDEILRQQLGFDGATFSDDLAMAGAGREPYAARVAAARGAGCDMALLCNDRAGAIAAIEGVAQTDRPASLARLMRMHGRPAAEIDHRLWATREWRDAAAAITALAAPDDHETGLGVD